MDFRLLVKQSPVDETRPSVVVDGVYWSLTDSLDIDNGTIPEYACVSYVWGQGRANNLIHLSILMSNRTLPVLSAAIRNSRYQAFWVDAFCVPSDPLLKGPTLESMGYIYGRAEEVIVVLAPESFAAVKEMSTLKRGEVPETRLLDILEREMWIRSVWTYQEVVNSSRTSFIGEGSTDGRMLNGSEFLNALGYYLVKYRESLGISVFNTRIQYPNLDTFEDLILDWLTADYAERSALEIMSNMARRYYEDPKNYFYSMIGALTKKPSKRTKKPSVETLAETFMAIAEEKGDYSFIFASAPRDKRPGLEWRPSPQILRPIVLWHVDGEILAGSKEPNGVILRDVVVARPSSTVGHTARQIVCTWLRAPELEDSPDEFIFQKLSGNLSTMGFTATGGHIMLQYGYTFPQEEVPQEADVEVWLTTGIHYIYGAPAMIIARMGDITQYIPAVHFGEARQLKDRQDVFIPINTARL